MLDELLVTNEMLDELSVKFKLLLKIYKEQGLYKSKKQLSEDMSGLLEHIMSNHYDGSIPAQGDDGKPNLTLLRPYKNYGNIVEIKCTSGNIWRGGKLSKRPGFYVLVSWKMYPPTFISGGDFTLNIFCAGIYLTPDDWDKKELDENTKYYATSYPYKKLLDNPFELYHGNINEGKTKKLVCSEI